MKKIPIGAWIFCPSIGPETTEESLQDFLAERGVELPLENISINDKHTSAMISIDNDCAAILVNWATNCGVHDGRTVSFTGWRTPPRDLDPRDRGKGRWQAPRWPLESSPEEPR
jgi:hypothetical protein